MTPSEQATADAIADAETLRLNIGNRLQTVNELADALCAVLIGHGQVICPPDPEGRYAFYAARAAFRAVPGLKG